MSASNVIVVLGSVLTLGSLACLSRAARRRRRLRAAFGPEFDHVARERHGVREAERELVRRTRRHDTLRLRPIGPRAQNSYALSWKTLRGRFTDDPLGAVLSAERLVGSVATSRGYPAGHCGERLALLSVEHPCALAEYREAQSIGERGRTGAATTEELREALARYHVLFVELLVTPVPARLR